MARNFGSIAFTPKVKAEQETIAGRDRRGGMFETRTRTPTLDEAVNKRLLSTGESRELVRENLGSGLNPGG